MKTHKTGTDSLPKTQPLTQVEPKPLTLPPPPAKKAVECDEFDPQPTLPPAPTEHVPVAEKALWAPPVDAFALRLAEQVEAAFANPPPPNTAPQTEYGNTLPDDHPLLTPTHTLTGREALQAQLQAKLLDEGRGGPKLAFWLSGPMGTGKLGVLKELQHNEVVPKKLVRADADYIHPLIPEAQQLLAHQDGRAFSVVHEEASSIAQSTFPQAMEEGLPVLRNTMFYTEDRLDELGLAQQKGYKTVVVAVVASTEISIQRAGSNGRYVPHKGLLESHKVFAQRFEQINQRADAVVLVDYSGGRPKVVAVGSKGALEVRDPKAVEAFLAGAQLQTEHLPPDAI